MNRTLLYVDDQPENLVVFQAAFEGEFDILEATSPREALELLETREVGVLVADQRMPDMTGVELCEIVRRERPFTIRMILTGYSEMQAIVDAINKGQVYNFISKPWDRDTLRATLIRGFEAHELIVSNAALLERLEHTERSASLGQCAARVAHEMRNQLLVLPLIELIETQYSDHQQLRELAEVARMTHDRLNELIDEIRVFSRNEHNDTRKVPANLAALTREALSLASLHSGMPRRALRLSVQSEPTIHCHTARIQQVIFNLVRNAADAVKSCSSPEIAVTVKEHAEDALLIVQDNGPGIDQAHAHRVGEPFFTTKGVEGTGLGLDICRRILAAHGGTLNWDSAPAEGATFTARMPKSITAQAL